MKIKDTPNKLMIGRLFLGIAFALKKKSGQLTKKRGFISLETFSSIMGKLKTLFVQNEAKLYRLKKKPEFFFSDHYLTSHFSLKEVMIVSVGSLTEYVAQK